jgi:hypothetical protein
VTSLLVLLVVKVLVRLDGLVAENLLDVLGFKRIANGAWLLLDSNRMLTENARWSGVNFLDVALAIARHGLNLKIRFMRIDPSESHFAFLIAGVQI